MINIKKYGDFITNTIVGCKFVGLSSDKELFIEFEYENDSLKLNAIELLQMEFSEIKKVVIVEKININKAKKMVDNLNEILRKLKEEEQEKKSSNLLNITNF